MKADRYPVDDDAFTFFISSPFSLSLYFVFVLCLAFFGLCASSYISLLFFGVAIPPPSARSKVVGARGLHAAFLSQILSRPDPLQCRTEYNPRVSCTWRFVLLFSLN